MSCVAGTLRLFRDYRNIRVKVENPPFVYLNLKDHFQPNNFQHILILNIV